MERKAQFLDSKANTVFLWVQCFCLALASWFLFLSLTLIPISLCLSLTLIAFSKKIIINGSKFGQFPHTNANNVHHKKASLPSMGLI